MREDYYAGLEDRYFLTFEQATEAEEKEMERHRLRQKKLSFVRQHVLVNHHGNWESYEKTWAMEDVRLHNKLPSTVEHFQKNMDLFYGSPEQVVLEESSTK